MKINESDSIIVVEDAPIYFLDITQSLPWKIIWWEGTLLIHGLLEQSFVPTTIEGIKHPFDDFPDKEYIDEDDVTIKLKIFFYKVKE